ncbi:hypothetical protein LINPERHAP1_LOCUS6186, partial [Linum perenne]
VIQHVNSIPHHVTIIVPRDKVLANSHSFKTLLQCHEPATLLLIIPLTKVKVEKLVSPPSTISITPPSSIGDELQAELGCDKCKQTKKQLFCA